jgi:hypothetical protein
MNPWHYASRQSYNTFKGNSFQKDAVEDKFGFVQFRPRFRSGNDAAGFGADCGSATTAAFFNQRFLNSMNEYNCKDFCILFKIHGKLPVAFGVRRHVAAFMVGNKLPTNAAGSKAQGCNVFSKKSGQALNPPRTPVRLFLVQVRANKQPTIGGNQPWAAYGRRPWHLATILRPSNGFSRRGGVSPPRFDS